MVTTPIFSIITPTYNSIQYLGDVIEGVLSQTFSEWELILIDDQSTDKTIELAKEYVNKDDRIRLVLLEKKGGPAVARNRGIDLARGRYIAFCDSDDIWFGEKLEKQLTFMEQNDAAICFTSYLKMEESGKVSNRLVQAPNTVSYRQLLRSNYIGCSTAVYDSTITGKVFMPNTIKRQDYGLWLFILRQGHIAYGIQEPLVYYRMRASSVSSDKALAAQYHWKVLREHEKVPLLKACWLFVQYAWIGFLKTLR